MTGAEVRPIDSPARAQAAHAALVDAFDGYPLTEWIVRRDARHPQRLGRYVREMMSLSEAGGQDLVEVEGRGAALWRAPEAEPLDGRALLRRASALPAVIGWRNLATRVPGLWRLASDHPPEPHAYLSMLGVRSAHQRSGIGGALLRAGLARCDASGVGAFLHTANEAALPFYRSHGFEEQGTIRVPQGPRVWRLWRPPVAPG